MLSTEQLEELRESLFDLSNINDLQAYLDVENQSIRTTELAFLI
ncbi:MAG: DUF4351 domain-containing protein [Cyanobacteria bacterium J06649_11]